MAWRDIADAALEQDKPVRAIDALALRDNPVAIAEGASGAPRLTVEARGGREVLLASVTAAASATVDFVLPDGWDSYMIEFFDVKPSASSNLLAQTSIDGGATFATATYDYKLVREFIVLTNDVVGAVAQAAMLLGTSGAGTLYFYQGEVQILGAANAAAYTALVGNLIGVDSTTGFHALLRAIAQRRVAEVTNAVRLLPSSGNFTSGTFRLWGRRHTG